MVTMVISELKSISRLNFFRETKPRSAVTGTRTNPVIKQAQSASYVSNLSVEMYCKLSEFVSNDNHRAAQNNCHTHFIKYSPTFYHWNKCLTQNAAVSQ